MAEDLDGHVVLLHHLAELRVGELQDLIASLTDELRREFVDGDKLAHDRGDVHDESLQNLMMAAMLFLLAADAVDLFDPLLLVDEPAEILDARLALVFGAAAKVVFYTAHSDGLEMVGQAVDVADIGERLVVLRVEHP